MHTQTSLKTARAHQNTCCVIIHSSPFSQHSPFFSYQTCTRDQPLDMGEVLCVAAAHTYKPKAFQLVPGSGTTTIWASGGLVMDSSYRHPHQHTGVNHAWGHLGDGGAGSLEAAIMESRGRQLPRGNYRAAATSEGRQATSIFYMGGKLGLPS